MKKLLTFTFLALAVDCFGSQNVPGKWANDFTTAPNSFIFRSRKLPTTVFNNMSIRKTEYQPLASATSLVSEQTADLAQQYRVVKTCRLGYLDKYRIVYAVTFKGVTSAPDSFEALHTASDALLLLCQTRS